MCEVWKWIMIVAAGPLIVGYVYAFEYRLQIGWFRWFFRGDPNAWQREYQKVRWFLPAWFLGLFILLFSMTIYAIHCAE